MMQWKTHTAHDAWPLAFLKQGPPGEQVNPIDPYAIWASVTGFRGFAVNNQFRRPPGDSWVSFIAEATTEADFDQAMSAAEDAKKKHAASQDKVGMAGDPVGWFFVPKAYRVRSRREQAGLMGSTFFTGRVRVRDLWRLCRAGWIKRWELGLPGLAPREAGEPQAGLTSQGLSDESMNDPLAAAPIAEKDSDDGSPLHDSLSSRGVISVIDFGGALFNRSFIDSHNKCRMAFLWDQHQSAATADVWTNSYGFGYGRVITYSRVEHVRSTPHPNEEVLYRRIRYLQERAQPDRPLKRAVHGTHVLDVVGGCSNPWHRVNDGLPRHDAAGNAWLHFVHLPIETAVDSSGGSLAVHVLDGVRDALLRCAPGVPLVIVLSQGTHAGPHDGSSLLEAALDQLLGLRKENFAVVIGAGNGRIAQNEESVGCHAVTTILAGRPGLFRVHLPEGDTTDTYVEVWCHAPARIGDLKLRLVPPSPLQPSGWVGANECVAGLDMGTVCCSIIHTEHTPGGRGRMVLVALSPTSSDDAGQVPAGEWKLEVETDAVEPVEIHAWVERDEPLRGAAFDWPRFVGEEVSDEGNVNTVATGKLTIVAGAMRFMSGQESPYSAHGPLYGERAGAKVPAVLVASDESAARPGLRAAAVLSQDTHRMGGTSVSAPTLARLLFNEMMARREKGESVDRVQWVDIIAALASPAGLPAMVRRVR